MKDISQIARDHKISIAVNKNGRRPVSKNFL